MKQFFSQEPGIALLALILAFGTLWQIIDVIGKATACNVR